MTNETDPPRRQAERIRYHAENAPPEDDERSLFHREMGPRPAVQFMTEEDLDRHRRLIEIEPELSKMVAGKRAWALVGETLKKVALWLSAISGGLLVLREFFRMMSK